LTSRNFVICSPVLAAVAVIGLSMGAVASALPKLSVANVTVSEASCSSQVATFTVTVNAPFGKNGTVQFATADGTAVAGVDYTAVSGTLSFPRGSKSPQTITVPITDVLIPGANKTFYVNLTNPQNDTLINSQASATITAPTVAKCQSCGLSCNKGDACFTDSCDAVRGCQHVNRSTTSEPYCQLAGQGIFAGSPDPDFGHCEAVAGGGIGEWVDSDGDGFSDAAETQGYLDINTNGIYDPGIDVLLPGADPNKPDVYLHYDYMAASDHDHNPPAQAVQWMVDAFAARGVTLHIDPVHNAIPEAGQKVVTNQTSGPPDFTINSACAGDVSTGGAVSMHTLAQQYLGNLAPAYHYMVFAHFSTCPDATHCSACGVASEGNCVSGSTTTPPFAGAIGDAEVNGSHAIVSLGPFVDADVAIPFETSSGVTMHELGHNFGLVHGGITSSGPDCSNQKPNYLSVMNYSFTTAGIPVASAPGEVFPKSCTTDADCTAPAHCSGPTGSNPNTCVRIDYASALLPNLNENSLDETAGLNVSSTSTDLSVFYTNGGITPVFPPTNGSPIDWNQDGSIETNACADVSGTSTASCGSLPTLLGANDWTTRVDNTFANLNFAFQCTSNYQSDTAASLAAPSDFDRLLQRYALLMSASRRRSLSKTAVLVAGPSGTRLRQPSAHDWLKEDPVWPRR
jgi:Calx-beta domain